MSLMWIFMFGLLVLINLLFIVIRISVVCLICLVVLLVSSNRVLVMVFVEVWFIGIFIMLKPLACILVINLLVCSGWMVDILMISVLVDKFL